jgi:hypothetical protein
MADPLPPAERVERVSKQGQVGKNLHENVDERAERAKEDDDEEPDRIRPSANEVNDRDSLQEQAPWKQQREESHISTKRHYLHPSSGQNSK